jgi:sarcosine oxidase delta subunit
MNEASAHGLEPFLYFRRDNSSSENIAYSHTYSASKIFLKVRQTLCKKLTKEKSFVFNNVFGTAILAPTAS